MSDTATIRAGPKGITFSGETFIVPETHDMVKALFDPSIRKSFFEKLILALLASNFLVFYFVNSNSTRILIFIATYVFWRFLYNFGIGFLLNQQSNHEKLSETAKSSKIFTSTRWLGGVLRNEIISQMGPDYVVDDYPTEFNTWLIFRKFVDLILMLDFTTFICLVIACSIDKDYQFINTDQQLAWLVYTRIAGGSSLILFNLWVKVNAHNTIKDYAWYWGDFFFRQINNEELIFDGVFEMVPHPMYSIGYIGYYGFALILKSYSVLCVSIFGHFLQMIFLHYIENPHIDKIYGSDFNTDSEKLIKLKDLKFFDNLKPLVGLSNFNFLRSTDLISLIIALTYGIIIPILSLQSGDSKNNFTSNFAAKINPTGGNLIFFLTISIKLFELISISTLLTLQSYYKTFTKFCLSNDIPVEKSLNNWSIIYNSLILLTYSSFFGLNLTFWINGLDSKTLYFENWTYLRTFIGSLLVFTQFWINNSIIDLIGYFGWFYGDFFIPRSISPSQRSQLTKAGIYRYLNNPEQIFGVCGIFGVTLIFPCFENVLCCLLWVGNNFIRINFIEKIHMIKLYGEQEVLKDSGVTKTFKKHLIPDVLQRKEKSPFVANRRKSSITNSLDSFIKELRSKNSKMSNQKILELSQGLYFENSDYKIIVKNLQVNKEGNCKGLKFKCISIGEPIEIEWETPQNNNKDWIGLYKISQTSYSRNKTLISSAGKWVWCNESGSAIFEGDRLFWEEGVYEFRYHLDKMHDVAYISEPFEIKSVNIEVPISISESKEFAKTLKTCLFDKILKPDESTIDSNISDFIKKDIVTTYERLAMMISLATDIKIKSRIFLSGDDTHLTINKLSKKLIKMKQVLDELSYEISDIEEKKGL